MPTARELMKPNPITVRPDASFLEIQRLFVEAQISGAPIVDSQGVVHGIITTTDLLAAIDKASDDEIDDDEPEDPADLMGYLTSMTASEVGTLEAIWVSPDATAAEVARVMHDEGVPRVLVGSDGHLMGILTAFDLVRLLAP
jgi:CBS domain-containing protein